MESLDSEPETLGLEALTINPEGYHQRTLLSQPSSTSTPGFSTSNPDTLYTSVELLTSKINLTKTWRNAPTWASPLLLKVFLDQESPELTRPVVDFLLSSDRHLNTFLDFLVRPVGDPLHEGGGDLGPSVLAA